MPIAIPELTETELDTIYNSSPNQDLGVIQALIQSRGYAADIGVADQKELMIPFYNVENENGVVKRSRYANLDINHTNEFNNKNVVLARGKVFNNLAMGMISGKDGEVSENSLYYQGKYSAYKYAADTIIAAIRETQRLGGGPEMFQSIFEKLTAHLVQESRAINSQNPNVQFESINTIQVIDRTKSPNFLSALQKEAERIGLLVNSDLIEIERGSQPSWNIINISPIAGDLTSKGFKKYSSSQRRLNMPFEKDEYPGQILGKVAAEARVFTRSGLAGNGVNEPVGGGAVFAEMPYVQDRTNVITHLAPGVLSSGFKFTEQGTTWEIDQPIRIASYKVKSVDGKETTDYISAAHGGSPHGEIEEHTLILGVGEETRNELLSIFAGDADMQQNINIAFGKPILQYNPVLDKGINESEFNRNQQMRIDARHKVGNALLEKFGTKFSYRIEFTNNQGISIQTGVLKAFAASNKGGSGKTAEQGIDPSISVNGFKIFNLMSGNTIKDKWQAKREDILFYTLAPLDRMDIREAEIAERIRQKYTTAIGHAINEYDFFDVNGMATKILPPELIKAYETEETAILALGGANGAIFHQYSEENTAGTPEYINAAGRVSAMPLAYLAMGGAKQKAFVKNIIETDADPSIGSIVSALAQLGGQQINIDNLPISENTDMETIGKMLDSLGISRQKAIQIKTNSGQIRTVQSFESVGKEGSAYQAWRQLMGSFLDVDYENYKRTIEREYLTHGPVKKSSELDSVVIGGKLKVGSSSDTDWRFSSTMNPDRRKYNEKQNTVFIGRLQIRDMARQLSDKYGVNVNPLDVWDLIDPLDKKHASENGLVSVTDRAPSAAGGPSVLRFAININPNEITDIESILGLRGRELRAALLSPTPEQEAKLQKYAEFFQQLHGYISPWLAQVMAGDADDDPLGQEAAIRIKRVGDRIMPSAIPGGLAVWDEQVSQSPADLRALEALIAMTPNGSKMALAIRDQIAKDKGINVRQVTPGEIIKGTATVRGIQAFIPGTDKDQNLFTDTAEKNADPVEVMRDIIRASRPDVTPQDIAKSSLDVDRAKSEARIFGLTKSIGFAIGEMNEDEFNKIVAKYDMSDTNLGVSSWRVAMRSTERAYQTAIDFKAGSQEWQRAFEILSSNIELDTSSLMSNKIKLINYLMSESSMDVEMRDLDGSLPKNPDGSVKKTTVKGRLLDNPALAAYLTPRSGWNSDFDMNAFEELLKELSTTGSLSVKTMTRSQNGMSMLSEDVEVNSAVNFMRRFIRGTLTAQTPDELATIEVNRAVAEDIIKRNPKALERIMLARRNSIPAEEWMAMGAMAGGIQGDILRASIKAAGGDPTAKPTMPNPPPQLMQEASIGRGSNALELRFTGHPYVSASSAGIKKKYITVLPDGTIELDSFAASAITRDIFNQALAGNGSISYDSDSKGAFGVISEPIDIGIAAEDVLAGKRPANNVGGVTYTDSRLKAIQQWAQDKLGHRVVPVADLSNRGVDRSYRPKFSRAKKQDIETSVLPDYIKIETGSDGVRRVKITDLKAVRDVSSGNQSIEKWQLQQSIYAHSLVKWVKEDEAGFRKFFANATGESLGQGMTPNEIDELVNILKQPDPVGNGLVTASIFMLDANWENGKVKGFVDPENPANHYEHQLTIMSESDVYDDLEKAFQMTVAAVNDQNPGRPLASALQLAYAAHEAITEAVKQPGFKPGDYVSFSFYIGVDKQPKTQDEIAEAVANGAIETKYKIRTAKGENPHEHIDNAINVIQNQIAHIQSTQGVSAAGGTVVNNTINSAPGPIPGATGGVRYSRHGRGGGGGIPLEAENAEWLHYINTSTLIDSAGKLRFDNTPDAHAVFSSVFNTQQAAFFRAVDNFSSITPNEARSLQAAAAALIRKSEAAWTVQLREPDTDANGNPLPPNDQKLAMEKLRLYQTMLIERGKIKPNEWEELKRKNAAQDMEGSYGLLARMRLGAGTPMATITAEENKNDYDSYIQTKNGLTGMPGDEEAENKALNKIRNPVMRKALTQAAELRRAGKDQAEQTKLMTQAESESKKEFTSTDPLKLNVMEAFHKIVEKTTKALSNLNEATVPLPKNFKEAREMIQKQTDFLAQGDDMRAAVRRANVPGADAIVRGQQAASDELRASWQPGGKSYESAVVQFGKTDADKLAEVALGPTTKLRKEASAVASINRLTSGMFAFQVARELRYTFTPIEEAGTKAAENALDLQSYLGQAGLGGGYYNSGVARQLTNKADVQAGLGVHGAAIMGGFANLSGGDGAAFGRGPAGLAYSLLSPAIGAGLAGISTATALGNIGANTLGMGVAGIAGAALPIAAVLAGATLAIGTGMWLSGTSTDQDAQFRGAIRAGLGQTNNLGDIQADTGYAQAQGRMQGDITRAKNADAFDYKTKAKTKELTEAAVKNPISYGMNDPYKAQAMIASAGVDGTYLNNLKRKYNLSEQQVKQAAAMAFGAGADPSVADRLVDRFAAYIAQGIDPTQMTQLTTEYAQSRGNFSTSTPSILQTGSNWTQNEWIQENAYNKLGGGLSAAMNKVWSGQYSDLRSAANAVSYAGSQGPLSAFGDRESTNWALLYRRHTGMSMPELSRTQIDPKILNKFDALSGNAVVGSDLLPKQQGTRVLRTLGQALIINPMLAPWSVPINIASNRFDFTLDDINNMNIPGKWVSGIENISNRWVNGAENIKNRLSNGIESIPNRWVNGAENIKNRLSNGIESIPNRWQNGAKNLSTALNAETQIIPQLLFHNSLISLSNRWQNGAKNLSTALNAETQIIPQLLFHNSLISPLNSLISPLNEPISDASDTAPSQIIDSIIAPGAVSSNRKWPIFGTLKAIDNTLSRANSSQLGTPIYTSDVAQSFSISDFLPKETQNLSAVASNTTVDRNKWPIFGILKAVDSFFNQIDYGKSGFPTVNDYSNLPGAPSITNLLSDNAPGKIVTSNLEVNRSKWPIFGTLKAVDSFFNQIDYGKSGFPNIENYQNMPGAIPINTLMPNNVSGQTTASNAMAVKSSWPIFGTLKAIDDTFNKVDFSKSGYYLDNSNITTNNPVFNYLSTEKQPVFMPTMLRSSGIVEAPQPTSLAINAQPQFAANSAVDMQPSNITGYTLNGSSFRAVQQYKYPAQVNLNTLAGPSAYVPFSRSYRFFKDMASYHPTTEMQPYGRTTLYTLTGSSAYVPSRYPNQIAGVRTVGNPGLGYGSNFGPEPYLVNPPQYMADTQPFERSIIDTFTGSSAFVEYDPYKQFFADSGVEAKDLWSLSANLALLQGKGGAAAPAKIADKIVNAGSKQRALDAYSNAQQLESRYRITGGALSEKIMAKNSGKYGISESWAENMYNNVENGPQMIAAAYKYSAQQYKAMDSLGISQQTFNASLTDPNLQAGLMQMASGDPKALTYGLQSGVIKPGNSAGIDLPMFDTTTGFGLFQRSMFGLNSIGMPSTRGSYNSIESWMTNTMTQRYANSTRNPWTALSPKSQDYVLNALDGSTFGIGGQMGADMAMDKMQYDIGLRTLNAGAALSAYSARVDWNYAQAVTNPQKKFAIEQDYASKFGGKVTLGASTFNIDGQGSVTVGGQTFDYGAGQFEWEKRSFDIEKRNAAASFGQTQTRYNWQLQDINRQQYRSNVQYGWAQKELALGRSQTMANRGMQAYEFGYQTHQLQLQEGYAAQDYEYNKSMRQLQYGWQMQDYDINIRRATGFERKQLIKERDRATIVNNLERGHDDVLYSRQKQQFKLEEDHMTKQINHWKLMNKYEDEGYMLRKKQMDEQKKWQDQDFNIQKGRIHQEMGWANESYQRQLEAFQIKQEQIDVETANAKQQTELNRQNYEAEYLVSKEKFRLSQIIIGMTKEEYNTLKALEDAKKTMAQNEQERMVQTQNLEIDFWNSVLQGLAEANHQTATLIPHIKSAYQIQEEKVKRAMEGLPVKAGGGDIPYGTEAIVGETGPEIVSNKGHVMPTRLLTPRGLNASSAPVTVTVVAPINIDGKTFANTTMKLLVGSVNRQGRRHLYG